MGEFCMHHGYEPAPAEFLARCTHCGHYYPNANDLILRDQVARLRRDPRDSADPRSLAEITHCPLCGQPWAAD